MHGAGANGLETCNLPIITFSILDWSSHVRIIIFLIGIPFRLEIFLTVCFFPRNREFVESLRDPNRFQISSFKFNQFKSITDCGVIELQRWSSCARKTLAPEFFMRNKSRVQLHQNGICSPDVFSPFFPFSFLTCCSQGATRILYRFPPGRRHVQNLGCCSVQNYFMVLVLKIFRENKTS